MSANDSVYSKVFPYAGTPHNEPVSQAVRAMVDLQLDGAFIPARSVVTKRDRNKQRRIQSRLPPALPADKSFLFRSTVLKDLPFGHREAFSLRDEGGTEVARALLSARDDSVRFSAGSLETGPAISSSFGQFHSLAGGYWLVDRTLH